MSVSTHRQRVRRQSDLRYGWRSVDLTITDHGRTSEVDDARQRPGHWGWLACGTSESHWRTAQCAQHRRRRNDRYAESALPKRPSRETQTPRATRVKISRMANCSALRGATTI